ncbi:Sperm-specific class P protein 34 [Toxocara canis]|uniref:Sperm-specific class P protein 34 n=1 Tax=Toxocara canis TaxID=6265 RepID=A0A0B2VM80_TOXCA|nr:Sperm-specific class P protein 34 [Toxocara canis]
MALNIDPPNGVFPASGGTSIFNIINQTENRLAFKVKTSNNDCYRVTPVYGFVEKSSKVELTIIRLEGPPKEDKFVVQWAEVPDEETDPQAPFQAGAQAGEVIMAVKAE